MLIFVYLIPDTLIKVEYNLLAGSFNGAPQINPGVSPQNEDNKNDSWQRSDRKNESCIP